MGAATSICCLSAYLFTHPPTDLPTNCLPNNLNFSPTTKCQTWISPSYPPAKQGDIQQHTYLLTHSPQVSE